MYVEFNLYLMLNPLIIEYLINHFKLKNIPKESIFKSLQNNLSN